MTRPETEYENPYISRAEYEKLFLASPELKRMIDHAAKLAYDSIQQQPVSNLQEGANLISSFVRMQDANGGFHRFNFAFLTGGPIDAATPE